MCLSTGKQFKSCGVNASCFRPQGSSLKVVVSMHHVFSTGKYLKSYGVNASCVLRQGSILKAVVSMYHIFGNREAF